MLYLREAVVITTGTNAGLFNFNNYNVTSDVDTFRPVLCIESTTSNEINVIYNVNGGIDLTPMTGKTVTYGGTYGDLPTPRKTGDTFTGWYTAKSGGTKIESTTKVTIANDHTIYAHWASSGTSTM